MGVYTPRRKSVIETVIKGLIISSNVKVRERERHREREIKLEKNRNILY